MSLQARVSKKDRLHGAARRKVVPAGADRVFDKTTELETFLDYLHATLG
jgi:hypothetical protein